ncbi:MAG: hypothetical protein MI924_26335 [Chloroflexales bacterium]|nr:hypothetical protein [Chloroflexales bacterium]
MPIWEISFESDIFQSVELVDLTFGSVWIEWFKGQPIAHEWQPIEVAFLPDDQRLPGDFSSAGGAIIANQRALDLLHPLVAGCVEVLPLICKTATLYAMNVIKVIDCLDHAQSRFVYFSDGGIMRVEQYVFKVGCIGDTHLFKIPEQIRHRVYGSDTFKATVERNHLQGMLFSQIA